MKICYVRSQTTDHLTLRGRSDIKKMVIAHYELIVAAVVTIIIILKEKEKGRVTESRIYSFAS